MTHTPDLTIAPVAAATLGSGMPPPSRKALFVSSLLKSFYAIEGSEIKEW